MIIETQREYRNDHINFDYLKAAEESLKETKIIYKGCSNVIIPNIKKL